MKDDQRFPPLYKAIPFAVSESGGFVSINLQADAAPPPPRPRTMPLSGTVHVGLEQQAFLDSLYDDPGLLIDIRGVHFTSYLMSELREENGLLVMERACKWGKLNWPDFATADFPITLLSKTDPANGATELTLRDALFNTLLTAEIAPVQGGRGVTQVRWRAEVGATLKGRHARRLRRGTPFMVRNNIDAAALRVLKPSVSIHGQQLRDALLADASISAAA
jgi:hypothetical protein